MLCHARDCSRSPPIDVVPFRGQRRVPVQVFRPHLAVIRPEQRIVLPHPIVRELVKESRSEVLIGKESFEVVRPEFNIYPQPTIRVVTQHAHPLLRLLLHEPIIDGVHLAQGVDDQFPLGHHSDDSGVGGKFLQQLPRAKGVGRPRSGPMPEGLIRALLDAGEFVIPVLGRVGRSPVAASATAAAALPPMLLPFFLALEASRERVGLLRVQVGDIFRFRGHDQHLCGLPLDPIGKGG
mmetsp:Transcript_53478/g.160028  ORF Transcript_53478/g.160028 Transcript_53478/m.160028 type:complete len:237 (-) Transcript_53478:418-1128(-)